MQHQLVAGRNVYRDPNLGRQREGGTYKVEKPSKGKVEIPKLSVAPEIGCNTKIVSDTNTQTVHNINTQHNT